MSRVQPVLVCNINRKTPIFLLGTTLPELLIGLAITSLLIILFSHWVVYLYRYSDQQQQRLQLQQTVHQALQLMSKDIRRAGYHAPLSQNNLSLFQYQKRSLTLNLPKQDSYQCVMFFYDANRDGCIGTSQNQGCVANGINQTKDVQKELFGYRLNARQLEMLFMFEDTIPQHCSAISCQQHLNNPSCYSRGWTKVLDEQRYIVQDLAIRWLEEKRGLSIGLTVSLREQPKITYQATTLIPLLNEVKE
ncbi:hypothetical protein [Gallibacterium genomosp. 3]|uniref:hypothetical protein n=1 Tax=Gallibacterium genomosp. 3 TaxID=505345 RepID=UPI00080275A1|nr:hypothetical protein [Gallibacterium genomosp. 3]